MLVAGDRIGAYEIVRYLGGGGMGEVYLARHVHIGRKAAIKVLLPELSANADVVSRFFNEARATALLRHPSIVEILDCDVHPSGRAYIVMEFMQGESLGECLGRVGSFGDHPGTALAITGQIASALVAAHAKGIVHRDLKPDNVFLASTPEGEVPVRVKILDFGIAKLMGDRVPTTRMTSTGTLVGTPLYMSPEQCRGSGQIDHRTDIYSLGCVLFELMSGRPPFIREGAGELIIAHVSEEPPPLSSLVPSTPSPLGDLVRWMLEKDPDRRPQSMSEVVAQIEGLLDVPVARFTELVGVPAGFPVHAGADDSPPAAEGRNKASPAPPAISQGVGQTKALPDQSAIRPDRTTTFPDHAPTGARPTPPNVAQSGPRGSRARGGFLAALIVVAVIAGGAYLAFRSRGENRSGPATGGAGEGAQASSAADRAALRAAAESFLQTRAEPPWPASCRTTDPDLLRALAAAVRNLPGAPGPEQARGLAMLGALPETVPERWMIDARVALTADPDSAAAAAAHAVALCPSSAVAQNLRGNALQKLRRLDIAEAAYQDASRLAPEYLAPRFNLGLVQLQQGEAKAALGTFNQIAEASPDYPNLYLVRAEAHRKLGDQSGAIDLLEAEVKRHPDGVDGWWQLGRALSASDARRANQAFCRAKDLGHQTAICR